DHLGARTNHQIDTGLDVRVAGLADAGDAPAADADVCFDDAPLVEDEGAGDDGVAHLVACALPLAHAVSDDLAAAGFDLFAINGAILFDLKPQIGVCEAQAVAGGRSVHGRVGLPIDACHASSSSPIT